MASSKLPFRRSLWAALGFSLSLCGASLAQTQSDDPLFVLQDSFEPLFEAKEDAEVHQITQAAVDWLQRGDHLSELSELTSGDLGWLLNSVTGHGLQVEGGFSATWTGQIKPSQAGAYTFSISPINVSSEYPPSPCKQWMTVSINGQPLINATPENWAYEAEAVQLSANELVTLEVTYRYECSEQNSGRPPSALLFWKRPGTDRAIVPATALFLPDGEGSGLRGEYRRLAAGGVLATVVEPNLEHLWMEKHNFICKHPEVMKPLVAELWSRLTDPELLQSVETPSVENPISAIQIKDALQRKNWLNLAGGLRASYLSCQQRAEFMQLLADRPNLLRQLPATKAGTALYRRFRHGAEEPAMRFLGTWMQLHADIEPELTSNFYRQNRRLYRELTTSLVWQDGRGFDWLLNDYLELPDGSCSLPAAYTLAYCHLGQGKIKEWIELLDAKLADEALTGDRRVNWLLARAQAEEIRRSPVDRYISYSGNLNASRAWIEEAQVVAESESANRRTFKETVVRLAAAGQWEASRELIDQTGLVGNQETLAKWKTEIDVLELAAEDLQKQHQVDSQKSYLAELQRRRQRGVDAGADVSRYDTMIEAATPAEDTPTADTPQ